MIKVGVTGGIGSGKTTLCKEWEKLGAYVVYADDLAKKIMVDDAELKSQIKSVFGDDSYNSNGTLNRSHLAKEAFENNRVDELNALVHPALRKAVDKLVEKKEREGIEVFVKEAAILMQHGRPEDLDLVVLVTADVDTRVARVVQRDNTQEELVLDRVSKQQNFKDFLDLVDIKVSNNGSLEELINKAQELFNDIKKI